MDKETYEALKTIMAVVGEELNTSVDDEYAKSIEKVEDWIDEVAKEYACPVCVRNPQYCPHTELCQACGYESCQCKYND